MCIVRWCTIQWRCVYDGYWYTMVLWLTLVVTNGRRRLRSPTSRVYYIDHSTKTTTFISPLSGTIVEIPPHAIRTADDVDATFAAAAH